MSSVDDGTGRKRGKLWGLWRECLNGSGENWSRLYSRPWIRRGIKGKDLRESGFLACGLKHKTRTHHQGQISFSLALKQITPNVVGLKPHNTYQSSSTKGRHLPYTQLIGVWSQASHMDPQVPLRGAEPGVNPEYHLMWSQIKQLNNQAKKPQHKHIFQFQILEDWTGLASLYSF